MDFGFEAVRVMEARARRQVPLVVHFRGSMHPLTVASGCCASATSGLFRSLLVLS